MSDDEQAIRDLVAIWLRGTAAGDLSLILSLMAEDVVFLMPGRPPIRGKAQFAALHKVSGERFRIQAQSEIVEVMVYGGWAHCWTHLSVTMIPVQGGPAVRRSGHTLSILRQRPDGSWVLARDANMLAPESGPA